MVKRLVVSRNAYLDIDRIVEFNDRRNHSTTYSRKFVKALFKELKLLKKFPDMGISTSRENILLLIWNDYYIYYAVADAFVEIKAIYHQKENVIP
jgi:plasmid stabilization system protein ParE